MEPVGCCLLQPQTFSLMRKLRPSQEKGRMRDTKALRLKFKRCRARLRTELEGWGWKERGRARQESPLCQVPGGMGHWQGLGRDRLPDFLTSAVSAWKRMAKGWQSRRASQRRQVELGPERWISLSQEELKRGGKGNCMWKGMGHQIQKYTALSGSTHGAGCEGN